VFANCVGVLSVTLGDGVEGRSVLLLLGKILVSFALACSNSGLDLLELRRVDD